MVALAEVSAAQWAALGTICVAALGFVGIVVKGWFDRGVANITTSAATQAAKSKEHEMYLAFNEQIKSLVKMQAETIERLNSYVVEREATIDLLSSKLDENTETMHQMAHRIDELTRALEAAGVPVPPERKPLRDATRA